MHELAVTESILNIAVKNAEEASAARVTDIHLVIGQLSSIVDDSIQFYWDIISDGTICKGAVLHFERIPAKIQCQECHTEYNIENGLTACPECQSVKVKVINGEEFWLDSIEIEKQEQKTK